MPRKAPARKEPSKVIVFRVDPDVHQFYSARANAHGVSLSDHLRTLLVQGVITENAAEIEERLRGLLAEIQLKDAPAVPAANALPDEVLLSLFTSEALLTLIVEARDPQQLYAAQNTARAKLKKLKGN